MNIGWDNGPNADRIEGAYMDLGKLQAAVEAGLVRGQRHETLPLTIFKYTQQAVFTGTWDEITLRCRGVVVNDEGNIVVNGFTKFFNHSEPMGAVVYESHKGQAYEVTEKLDGSLIQAALWNGNLIVTSSGSFTSPQAAEGRKWISPALLKEGLTYLFEIIYPGNRIVLDYGDRNTLVLLAVRDTATGHELPYDGSDFETVKVLSMTLEAIEQELPRADYINKEGYIVRWEDGARVKMKYAEYMRLHKIVSGVNEKFVWEALRDGVDLETSLKGVPDELFQFVQRTSDTLKADYYKLQATAIEVFERAKKLPNRKEQAFFIMAGYSACAAIVFCMLDGKSHTEKIWKMIEPQKSTPSELIEG